MRIDRVAFLELTVLLSLVGCDRPATGPASPPQQVVIPLQPPPVVTAPAASAAASPGPTRDPAQDGACSNLTGSLAACARVGPACEGLAGECNSVAEDLRPRVAEKFAECFAKAHRPGCRDRTLGACMRKAVETACVEPFAEQLCHDLIARCSAAKKPAKYTFELCTKLVSAVNGGPNSTAWRNSNMELMGPSAESRSCTLDYVLIYQPWGASWK